MVGGSGRSESLKCAEQQCARRDEMSMLAQARRRTPRSLLEGTTMTAIAADTTAPRRQPVAAGASRTRGAAAADIDLRMCRPVPASAPPNELPALFARFSLRNSGRRARPAAAPTGGRPEEGAPAAAFVEAVYEPWMERLDVMFDDATQDRRMHGVARVTVETNAAGRDTTLSVDNAGGRFRLTFLDAER